MIAKTLFGKNEKEQNEGAQQEGKKRHVERVTEGITSRKTWPRPWAWEWIGNMQKLCLNAGRVHKEAQGR